ncbi:MAG: hypothetical protein RI945_27 [Candidatus Parcubacteria bacterium]|jgi:hypothetical protein
MTFEIYPLTLILILGIPFILGIMYSVDLLVKNRKGFDWFKPFRFLKFLQKILELVFMPIAMLGEKLFGISLVEKKK